MAANLTDAAHTTYSVTRNDWLAGTLKAQVVAFIAAAEPIFSDETPNDRPVGNWLIPLLALTTQMPAGVLPNPQYDACVTYIYRMCLAAVSQLASGLITNAQAVALLTAWNATIGP